MLLRLRVCLFCLLFVLLLPSRSLAQRSNAAGPTSAHTVTLTYLQAEPGQRAALGSFLRQNWLAMDSIAVQQGLFTSYELLQNQGKDPNQPPTWDYLVIVSYRDTLGYADIQPQFEAIRKAHKKVLVGGKDLPQLGRIVRSEDTLAW